MENNMFQTKQWLEKCEKVSTSPETTIKCWFPNFKRVRRDIEDGARSGRPYERSHQWTSKNPQNHLAWLKNYVDWISWLHKELGATNIWWDPYKAPESTQTTGNIILRPRHSGMCRACMMYCSWTILSWIEKYHQQWVFKTGIPLFLKSEIGRKWMRMKTTKTTKLPESSIEVFTHPTYSPDVVPCDYWLFAKFIKMLTGKKFVSNEKVIVAETDAFFEEKDKSL